MKTKTTPATERLIADIAKSILNIETLDERRMDSLDFHDVGVVSLREALIAAFNAGQQKATDEQVCELCGSGEKRGTS